MTSSTERSRQFYGAEQRDKIVPVAPTPWLDETDYYRASTTSERAWIDEAPTLMLPAFGIDQLPTQIGLRAIPRPVPSPHPLADGISIYDQPTWILPVIPGSVSAPTVQVAQNEGYVAIIRNLVKNSGIYALSSLASPLVSLVLAPFLTHNLSRGDYGALAILNTVVALVAGVTELGLSAAFTRMYAYDCKTRSEQLDALSTLTLLLLLILIPISFLLEMLSPWLSSGVLGSASYTGAIQVAIILVLSQNLTVPGLSWLRVENRATFFSIISIANLLLTASGNIVLVGILHMGIVGSLMANGLGNIIVIACTLPIIFLQAGFHLRMAFAWNMLAFGVPHVMNVISGWVLQLSDRFLLGHFASLSVVAGYSVAYSLGGVLAAIVILPFSLAWWVMMYPTAKRSDAQHVFKLIFRWFSLVILFATFGLSLFSISVLDLLFPASYHAQSTIIPVIALSTMFSGITVVVSLGTSLQRKTWIASLCFLISALLNIGFNIVLIPHYGAMGAALATLGAYIVLTWISYAINQKIYPVPFEIGLFLVALIIGIGLYIAGDSFSSGLGDPVAFAIHIGTLLLYGLCLVCIGWFSGGARKLSLHFLSKGVL
jgi:O-antigen/teichoic acid export membrane protein